MINYFCLVVKIYVSRTFTRQCYWLCFWAMYDMFMQSTDYFYQSHYTVNDVNYFICNVVAYQNIVNGEKFSSAIL